MKILVLNAGSSSQKSALFELGADSAFAPLPPLWEGKLEWDANREKLTIRNTNRKEIHQQQAGAVTNRRAPLETMLQNLWTGPAAVLRNSDEIEVVGHRIVHGGPKLAEPTVIDARVKQTVSEVAEIAPLHNKAGLEGIETAQKLFPGRPQIAVFDTGFHRTLPPHIAAYPGPYAWFERGIRRYGFHGINHEYCAQRAAQILGRDLSSLKLVTCHLGNGCSLAAIANGKSVNTTMGFTPLDGIMMGTRGGSVDPGILVHLMRTDHAGADELDDILNHHSGLLGISGISNDMRDVVNAAAERNQRAQLAFDIFVSRLQCGIAAMAASLGGLDVLVFTAGIGENSAQVRQATCASLKFLGIELDEANNSSVKPDVEIGSSQLPVRVLVIRAQEDWAIARECVRLSPSFSSRS
jgi:acetate kinase